LLANGHAHSILYVRTTAGSSTMRNHTRNNKYRFYPQTIAKIWLWPGPIKRYKLISSLFGNNMNSYISAKYYDFVWLPHTNSYFHLSTIQIPPNKLVHHVTVRIHSLSTHAKEEARDEEQDYGEEEDVVPD
jgi:hypothetical protein